LKNKSPKKAKVQEVTDPNDQKGTKQALVQREKMKILYSMLMILILVSKYRASVMGL